MNIEKFSRQMMLSFIGSQGQDKLSSQHVIVVGAGGLGCPLLMYLAAAGVGKITIIDHDTVSLSNLHRQILFTSQDIGQYKADIACKKLKLWHPDTELIALTQRLDSKLARYIAHQADLVIDGTDRFLSKYILSEICPVFLTASVVGMGGYMFATTPQTPVSVLFPEIPSQLPNCSDNGVLGSVAGIFGTFLATEALKILLNHPKTILHKLIRYDLNSFHFSISDLSSIKASSPVAKLPSYEYITSLDSIGNGIVIDVREQDELRSLKHQYDDSVVYMPLSSLDLSKISDIQCPILRCQTGRRAENTALRLGLFGTKADIIRIVTSS